MLKTIMRIRFLMISLLILLSCNQKRSVDTLQSVSVENYSVSDKNATVFTTADNTDYRLTQTETLRFKKLAETSEREFYVFVNPGKTFQTILGIGGALTDAAGETFAKIPEEKQNELLKAYYDPVSGIGYTLARTNINSCDFSSGSYIYVDEGDKELNSFNIDHDRVYKIPLIKKAFEAAGGDLTLFASPWSPPAYMKDNNDMLHGGKLKPEFYQSWALYYTKFIKSYEQEGINVWGITIQNEPMATQTWESCIYYAEDERDFLKNYLGPVMEKEGLNDRKIIVWDHNRDLIPQRAETIYDDPDASKYAWGAGFHWYEDWTGGEQMYSNVGLVHSAYPSKNLLFTEGTPASFNPEKYNDWGLGEEYGKSMINDFNNWAVGWTDWNILLDETGGPNHVGNFCFAPVHADTGTGELIYTNSYYYIGHFSKFIRPGSKRIMCAPSRSQLLATGFINPDGRVAVIIMNQTERNINYHLCFGQNESEIQILAHSIQTVVIE
jgi:glucosylceramidase